VQQEVADKKRKSVSKTEQSPSVPVGVKCTYLWKGPKIMLSSANN